MSAYAVYTIKHGKPSPGAKISILHLKGADIDIPAIIVGETGRGRERGALPVGNPPMLPCQNRGKTSFTSLENCLICGADLDGAGKFLSHRTHPDVGEVFDELMFAEVGKSHSGKPKLFRANSASSDDYVIVVLETQIGFRGSNSHTGDISGWRCGNFECRDSGSGFKMPDTCKKCGEEETIRRTYEDFPGKVLAKGSIAQGDAGRMGSGDQMVAVIPRGVVFRTGYAGRMYGAPECHYYMWNGSRILAVTWEEREASDIF